MTSLLSKYQGLSRQGKVLAVAGSLLFVAACGGGGIAGINTLGGGFTNAFNAGPNDTPVDASAISLTVDPTIDPFNP
ncbi:MAG: hypothetical protein ACU0CI_13735 [Shimia sp.]